MKRSNFCQPKLIKWMLPFLFCWVTWVIALGFIAPAVQAATINVPCTTTELINAVNTANTSSELDILNLKANCTYKLAAVNNSTKGANGLPVISSPMIMNGNGATIERSSLSGTPAFRIFYVSGQGSLTLKELVIQNGRLFNLLPPQISGAGILNSGGKVVLIGCTIKNNNQTTSRKEEIIFGGGIANIENGEIDVNDSTIYGNVAGFGGGIYHTGKWFRLTNSTVSNNVALGIPRPCIGGCPSPGQGAGLYVGGATELVNSTITSNEAVDRGEPFVGGIYIQGGNVSTVNTILAKQKTGADCGPFDLDSLGYNLDSDRSCGFSESTDHSGTDPKLEPFSDPGAPGKGHHSLQAGSPAIDAANTTLCPPMDQLSTPRRNVCDVGAIEFYPAAVINDFLRLGRVFTAIERSVPNNDPHKLCPETNRNDRGTWKIYAINPEFINISHAKSLRALQYVVRTLSGGNTLINADNAPPAGGVGSTVTIPDGALGSDGILSPGESFHDLSNTGEASLFICLASRDRFSFFIDVLGVPIPSD